MSTIEYYFGDKYGSQESREASYDMLENFIGIQHTDWNKAPNTAALSAMFSDKLADMPEKEFGFLICHTGFIPEVYAPDSSQETLYTKLVECVVAEWALRIGFEESFLPTAKGGKEDVLIADDGHIIVCDAKSYRLGRSQKAPNVKDALKLADIAKWLEHYEEERRLGGMVTFPSQHDWRNGSDFYLYATDARSPTPVLFYEHMSFMLLAGIHKQVLLDFFQKYPEVFPTPIAKNEGNRAKYFAALRDNILSETDSSWTDFNSVSDEVIKEKVRHTIDRLEKHLAESLKTIEVAVEEAMDLNEIKKELIAVKYQNANSDLIRQIENIKRFRDT